MPKNAYVEVVKDYKEFKDNISKNAPLHHSSTIKCIDQIGITFEINFKIYGIKENSNPIVYENIVRWDKTDDMENYPTAYSVYQELVRVYATPLNSTEGRWEYNG